MGQSMEVSGHLTLGAMDYMYGARESAMQRFLRKVLFNSAIAERLYA